MKKLLCILIFLIAFIKGFAQFAPIMVCDGTGTTCTPYFNLDAAVSAASPGSYIYIPGTTYSLSTGIYKELHLIGTGHYPDSSLVTGVSNITSTILFYSGSSNSSIEGLICNGINSYDSNANFVIKRCRTGAINGTGYPTPNWIIRECIVDNIYNLHNSSITNCIINSNISGSDYSLIGNNIFWGIGRSVLSLNYCIVKNCIFDSGSVWFSSAMLTGCTFYNNMAFYTSSFFNSMFYGLGGEYGTIYDVPDNNIFINAPGVSFDYSSDYHLKPTSPGHNYGDDGTDVGIYGGVFPYKAGALPANPHFFYESVPTATDTTGNLPVHFKVRAEN